MVTNLWGNNLCSHRVNEASIFCAQNYLQISNEYLTDNDEHNNFLNPENSEQNIVISIVLSQEECDDGGWKVN